MMCDRLLNDHIYVALETRSRDTHTDQLVLAHPHHSREDRTLKNVFCENIILFAAFRSWIFEGKRTFRGEDHGLG